MNPFPSSYLFVLILLLQPFRSFSQKATDTVWYDAHWTETVRTDAAFFRTGTYLKNGLYHVTDRFISGRLQMTGSFSSLAPEVKEGTFIYYDSLGYATVTESFSKGKHEGARTTYFPQSKEVFSRISFRDDERDGVSVFYFKKAGQVRGRMNYRRGRLTGTNTWYHLNGKVATRSVFNTRDSLGRFTEYDTSGMLRTTAFIDRDNLFQGKRTSYYPGTEIIRSEIIMVNDTPNGIASHYDFNCGSLRQQGLFKHGKQEGLWRFYNKCDSSLHATFVYRDGLKNGPVFVYDAASGMVTREGNDSAGLETGEWKYYFPGTQKLFMLRHYRNGKLDGTLTSYFPDGKLRRREEFAEGSRVKWNCYSTTGGDTVYYDRYTEPQYPQQFRRLLSRQIEYPEQALLSGLSGIVHVKIHIDAKGGIYHSEVVRTTNAVFNEEAMRVAMTLPIFAPGMDDGMPIETTLVLPVIFSPDNARAPTGDF